MVGKVFFVGAGPGDPDLITVRGLRALRSAQTVVYDRLVSPELVDMAPPSAERVYVGKTPGGPAPDQEWINALLVKRARAGRWVVRLKGGDPFVFGRGGEEALALASAGVPFEVVPGVTSAVAVPAFGGVPVTHRGVANAFVVVTGHPGQGKAEPDWAAVARIPTVVVLMGVGRLREICARMIGAGRHPSTPAVAIHRGTTPGQRVVRASLATLPDRVSSQGLGPPAVIVVGEVAALGERLSWFEPPAATAGPLPSTGGEKEKSHATGRRGVPGGRRASA